MKIIVDNQIVKQLSKDPAEILKNPLLTDPLNRIYFRWSSFLEYLGLGSIFSDLKPFDESNALFVALVTTLSANDEKEVVYHLFDHLFADHLTKIRNLEQINPNHILQAINSKQQSPDYSDVDKLFSETLEDYETAFADNPANTMHNLVLYLAWDRMCISMSHVFDYQSTNPKFINGIAVLKECLVESFLHISQQGRITPGFFRMCEALLIYQMREENLQNHSSEEWTILSQSFQILKSQNALPDYFYIDDMVVAIDNEHSKLQNSDKTFLTSETQEKVRVETTLARQMIDMLKSTDLEWKYDLQLAIIQYLS